MSSVRLRPTGEIALVAFPGALKVTTFGVAHAKTVLVAALLILWLAYALPAAPDWPMVRRTLPAGVLSVAPCRRFPSV